MVRLEWDPIKGKKTMVRQPAQGWKERSPIDPGQIAAAIAAGANSYLYALPDGIWVLDSDTPESVAWARQFGPAITVTPRGEHRLFCARTRLALPPGLPETYSDLSVRQLYGPGSFYERPGGMAVYTGTPVDFATVPAAPSVLTGGVPLAPVIPLREAVQPETNQANHAGQVASTPTAPADSFFGGAATTRSQAMATALLKLDRIRTGPLDGESARSGIRDAALYLGGLLHAGWFSAEQAYEQLTAACEQRWGQADGNDLMWIEQGLTDGNQPGKQLATREDDPVAVVPGKDGSPARCLADRLYDLDGSEVDPDPPAPMVADLIDAGTLGMIYAPGGSAKTFVALDLAMHVAAGLDWHGHACTRTNVLFVAAEGITGIRTRIRAWRGAHPEHAGTRVSVIQGAVDLFGGSELAEMLAIIREREIGWVVFDTYNRCTPGIKENDASDAGIVVRNAALLQSTGAALTVIHHTQKDGGTPRGSAAFEWATDWTLAVAKNGASVSVSTPRQKDRETGPVAELTLVSDSLSGSAYLVAGTGQPAADDLTNGAAHVPAEPAYDLFNPSVIGDELVAYTGDGQALVPMLAQLMAQHATPGTPGISRTDAGLALGRMAKDTTLKWAWSALWERGALTPAIGSRTPTSRCWWVEPGGNSRHDELVRRLL
jgi:hypothetical protein